MPTVGEKPKAGEEKEKPEAEERKSVDGEKQEEEEDGTKENREEKEQEKDKATGDILIVKESTFENISLIPEIQLHSSSHEEEEVVKKEEGSDRETALEKYKSLQAEGRIIVKKNMILLKKLAEYYRKHKTEHIYKTSESYSAEEEVRYHKQLLAFEEIRTMEKKEREVITMELEEMKKQRDELVMELKVEFDSLLQREREIGLGLISTKTGKELSDRVVEQLLLRQTKKLKEVNKVRLAFIKLRDYVAVKEAQLQSLETFGENLHLTHYEQLQMDNWNYAEKIEDKDEELRQLRKKATSVVHMIAHTKEKSSATVKKIDELCQRLGNMEAELNNTCACVTDLKKRRDFLRSKTLRLRREAGLLAHPYLLQDFAASIEEATHLSAQFQNLKNAFYDQKQSLSNIQKSIHSHHSVSSKGTAAFISSGTRPQ